MASSSGTARAEERRRARRRSRGRRLTVWIVRLAVLALVFVAGMAIGRAIEDTPSPGGTQTIVRTLEPLTVAPQERTVTVTTSAP
jgi:hypothetical protein